MKAKTRVYLIPRTGWGVNFYIFISIIDTNCNIDAKEGPSVRVPSWHADGWSNTTFVPFPHYSSIFSQKII